VREGREGRKEEERSVGRGGGINTLMSMGLQPLGDILARGVKPQGVPADCLHALLHGTIGGCVGMVGEKLLYFLIRSVRFP
jgi:hypothetical protein